MQVSVGGVLTQVLFLLANGLSLLVARPVSQDVHFKLLASHQFKAIHALCGQTSFFVRRKLHDRVASVLARVRVFRQFNCINLAEGREELTDVLLGQRGHVSNQTTDVDAVVLLSLLVLVAWCQSVAQGWQLILVSPIKEKRLAN